jgi:hypothetical protein
MQSQIRIIINRTPTSAGGYTFSLSFNRAGGKINGFAAAAAIVRPIKFIRENFFFCSALGTFAGNYL